MTDEHDRSPLLTTRSSRPSISTIRDTMYGITRPCWRGAECPCDRGPVECDATTYTRASKRPSSKLPSDVLLLSVA